MWILLLLLMQQFLVQQQPLTLGLVDPYDWHNQRMLVIAQEEGVELTLYDDNVVSGMIQAWRDRRQVVVVETTLFCHPAYHNALLLLSTTSQVYVPAGDYRHAEAGKTNCPEYRRLMTVVSGLKDGKKPSWLLHDADIWIECLDDPCSTSEAVMRAGARAAKGLNSADH